MTLNLEMLVKVLTAVPLGNQIGNWVVVAGRDLVSEFAVIVGIIPCSPEKQLLQQAPQFDEYCEEVL